MNDWLDYQGSGSSRAYIGETIEHGRFRDFTDKVVKEVGDVVTLPFDMAKLGKQMQANARLIAAQKEKYDKYNDIANQYAKLCNNPLYIFNYKSNKANYERYRKLANQVKQEMANIYKDAQEDYKKLESKVSDNAIVGPIYNTIVDIMKSIPATAEIVVTTEMQHSYDECIKRRNAMNDWLDYQGSGSSRAYIAHSKLFSKDNEQTKADLRLLDAYAAKAYKLKDEYITLLNNYNTSMMMYHRYKREAESQESNRAELASKPGQALRATQFFEKNVWMYKKDAANAKSEADSYLTQLKANIDAQKKLQADANELKVNMKKDSTRSLTTYDPKTIFIPDELPSNVNQRIKQSYFDMPTDEFIEHAFLGIESKKEREARLKDQKEKQSKAESALIDSQFDLAIKYQTEYNQNKDKLTKAKKSADDLYSRYSETAAQLTKLEKQQREMSSSGVSQEVLRRNVPIIPQLRNKKEVLNDKYQEAYAKYIELRDRQKWLDDKLKSIVKYFDADGRIDSYGK